MSEVAAFAAIAALLTVTPGADMALVTRNALSGGLGAAVRTALGITAGVLAWGAASALGVAALLETSATAFGALKLAGAAYLTFLGAQTIWRTRRSRRPPVAAVAPHPPSRGSAFGQGLLTNLLNPKIALFYSAVLPQFVSPGEPVLAKSLLLAGIHGAIGVAWLSLYARIVVRAEGLLKRPRVRRALDRLTGAVLISLGARLALERR